MRTFREAVMDCGLTDLGYEGSPFTFSNRRSGGWETRARLDRMLANSSWRRIYPEAQVNHLPAISSDHNFLVLSCKRRKWRREYMLFKFEPMWIREENFGEVVTAAWKDSGSRGTTFADRIKDCGMTLAKWNKEKFGKVGRRLKDLKMELELVRSLDRNIETMAKEAKLVEEIDEWRLREEILWRQRSRIDWLKEGDRNTKFFHTKASQRKKSNKITKLQNREGGRITEEAQLGALVREYFTDIFTSSKSLGQEEYDCAYKCVRRKVTTDMVEKGHN
ncbi:hypothetical protein QQ045_019254 [Rhodiola kirilowii]